MRWRPYWRSIFQKWSNICYKCTFKIGSISCQEASKDKCWSQLGSRYKIVDMTSKTKIRGHINTEIFHEIRGNYRCIIEGKRKLTRVTTKPQDTTFGVGFNLIYWILQYFQRYIYEQTGMKIRMKYWKGPAGRSTSTGPHKVM